MSSSLWIRGSDDACEDTVRFFEESHGSFSVLDIGKYYLGITQLIAHVLPRSTDPDYVQGALMTAMLVTFPIWGLAAVVTMGLDMLGAVVATRGHTGSAEHWFVILEQNSGEHAGRTWILELNRPGVEVTDFRVMKEKYRCYKDPPAAEQSLKQAVKGPTSRSGAEIARYIDDWQRTHRYNVARSNCQDFALKFSEWFWSGAPPPAPRA